MKGWSLALMASTFTAFAASRVVTSLAAGGMVDRLSARRIFPLVPLPTGLRVTRRPLPASRTSTRR
jgi:hypothetical protein